MLLVLGWFEFSNVGDQVLVEKGPHCLRALLLCLRRNFATPERHLLHMLEINVELKCE